MKYNVDYFIKFFSAIPEEKWCTGRLHDNNGNSCALGHCYYSQEYEKEDVVDNLMDICGEVGIGSINDGDEENYQQATPKQRILAFLNDKKKANAPKHIDITAELAVLPVEETIDNPKIKEYVEL